MKKVVFIGVSMLIACSSVVQAASVTDCSCLLASQHNKKKVSNKTVPVKKTLPVAKPTEELPAVKAEAELPSINSSEVPVVKSAEAPVVKSAEVPVVKSAEVPVVKSAASKTSGIYLGISAGYLQHQAQHKSAMMAGRLYGGYELNEHLALETGYLFGTDTVFKKHADDHQPVKTRQQGMDIAVIYRSTTWLPGLYAKAGAAYMFDKQTQQITEDHPSVSPFTFRRPLIHVGPVIHHYTTISKTSKNHHMDAMLGIGYEASINQHLSIDVGYTRYQSIRHHHPHAMHYFSVGSRYAF